MRRTGEGARSLYDHVLSMLAFRLETAAGLLIFTGAYRLPGIEVVSIQLVVRRCVIILSTAQVNFSSLFVNIFVENNKNGKKVNSDSRFFCWAAHELDVLFRARVSIAICTCNSMHSESEADATWNMKKKNLRKSQEFSPFTSSWKLFTYPIN